MIDLCPSLRKVTALKSIFDFYQTHRYDSYEASMPYYRLELIMGLILKNKDHIEEILKYDAGFSQFDFEFSPRVAPYSRDKFVTGFEKFFFEVTWEARRYCTWHEKKRSYSPTGEAISSNLIQCQFESD